MVCIYEHSTPVYLNPAPRVTGRRRKTSERPTESQPENIKGTVGISPISSRFCKNKSIPQEFECFPFLYSKYTKNRSQGYLGKTLFHSQGRGREGGGVRYQNLTLRFLLESPARQKFPKQPHKASFMDSNMLGIKPS